MDDTKEAGLDCGIKGVRHKSAKTISLLSFPLMIGEAVVTTTVPSVAGIKDTTIPALFAAVSKTSDGPGLTRLSPSELCESSSGVT